MTSPRRAAQGRTAPSRPHVVALAAGNVNARITQLLSELPAIHGLPAGDPRREVWLERKRQLLVDLGQIAAGPPGQGPAAAGRPPRTRPAGA